MSLNSLSSLGDRLSLSGLRPVLSSAPAVSPNLLQWTEEFDNVIWAKTGVVVTADAAIDPIGGSTAESCVFVGSGHLDQITSVAATVASGALVVGVSASWQRFSVGGLIDGTGYTLSCFLLSGDAPDARLSVQVSGGFASVRIAALDPATISVWGAKLELGGLTDYVHRTT